MPDINVWADNVKLSVDECERIAERTRQYLTLQLADSGEQPSVGAQVE